MRLAIADWIAKPAAPAGSRPGTPTAPGRADAAACAGPGLHRPARVLAGWLPEVQAEMILSGNLSGAPVPPVPGNAELARLARAAVMTRRPGTDQQGVAAAPPPELDDHIAALNASPAGAAMLAAGWRVAVADLGRICAFQPAVFADAAADRVASADADDLPALARITLPVTPPEPAQVGFDAARQAFTVLSPDPNLRIIGQYRSPVPDARGALSLGFLVQVTPSYLQVIEFGGRYLLSDGYHRAYGLLGRGIRTVPVFLRAMASLEEFAVAGMLPNSAFLGPRPPLLPDYHDDQVACSVLLPVPQKMIVIQGIELNPTAIVD